MKRALLEEDADITESEYSDDDEDIMTPFAGDAISSIMHGMKPFRNIIKRYWTEEEVCYNLTYVCSGQEVERTRWLVWGKKPFLRSFKHFILDYRLKTGRESLLFLIIALMCNASTAGKKYWIQLWLRDLGLMKRIWLLLSKLEAKGLKTGVKLPLLYPVGSGSSVERGK